MKKQSAVDWLTNELEHCLEKSGSIEITPSLLIKLKNQAKEIEKAQMKEASLHDVTPIPAYRKLFENQFMKWYKATYE